MFDTGNQWMFVNLGMNRHLREKRAHVRNLVSARVRLSHSTFGVIHATTRDISDSGVHVILPERLRLPVGAHIKMQMLESALPDIAFNMKVVRCENEGVSLQFVDYEIGGQRFPMANLRKMLIRSNRLSS
jgi:hypothetical protein